MASRAVSLYRTILRLHKTVLPPDMRQLGDKYVRHEFDLHKAAKPEFLDAFFREWEGYAAQLAMQGQPPAGGVSSASAQSAVHDAGGVGVGMDLSAEDVEALSEEQLNQLAALKAEAQALRESGGSSS